LNIKSPDENERKKDKNYVTSLSAEIAKSNGNEREKM
jgi:hypothetical protein